MNIFVLDRDIRKCAEYSVDKHVTKMPLESTQILCTVVNESGGSSPYKTTHKNHPCTIWAKESLSNWLWLKDLAIALNEEWQFRFNHTRNHKSVDVALSLTAPDICDIGLTEFHQAMPDQYKSPDVVQAYRDYYIGEKSHLAKWSKRSTPEWFNA